MLLLYIYIYARMLFFLMSNHFFCFIFTQWLNASFSDRKFTTLQVAFGGSVFRSSEKRPIYFSKSLKLKRIFSPLDTYLILVYTIDTISHFGKYYKNFTFYIKKKVSVEKKMSLKIGISKTALSCLEVIKKFMFLICEKWIAKIRLQQFNCQEILIICGIIVPEKDLHMFLYH